MTYNKEKSRQFDLISFLGFFGWLFLGASLFAVPMFIIAPMVLDIPYDEYLSNMQLVTEHTYIPATIAHILGIALFAILYRKVIKEDLINFKNKWWQYLLIIFGAFGLLFLSNILMNIIYQSLGITDTSNNQESIIAALTGSTKPFVIVYTVILAPIFEEVVFRKLFYNCLKKYTKLPIWAIVLIISAVFAFVHVSDLESLMFFPQYFVLALIITATYAITKENLLACIGLHFLNNLWAVLEILL